MNGLQLSFPGRSIMYSTLEFRIEYRAGNDYRAWKIFRTFMYLIFVWTNDSSIFFSINKYTFKFFSHEISKKNMVSSALRIVSFVCFLEESRTPYFFFEIYWPSVDELHRVLMTNFWYWPIQIRNWFLSFFTFWVNTVLVICFHEFRIKEYINFFTIFFLISFKIRG